MNLKLRLKELSVKSEAVTEFARGDYAIPALLKIQKAGRWGQLPLDLTRGNTISALKGNQYPALDGWNGYLSGAQIRKTAADKIRRVLKTHGPGDDLNLVKPQGEARRMR